jgi:hypothetical protein
MAIDSFEMQKRYFTVQLERFRVKPGLHRAMIRDCEHFLGMLEESGSLGAFKTRVQSTGNMVSTAKAKAHDTFSNRAFVYESLGHHRKAEEDRQRLKVIEAARTHAELSEKLQDFQRNNGDGLNENKALGALGTVVKALFHLCTDGTGSQDEKRSLGLLQEYWRQFTEADPNASWEKIMTHRPYRDRIPFTDRQMAFLEKKFREVSHGQHA